MVLDYSQDDYGIDIPNSKIKKVEKYDVEVWSNVKMDELRRDECLCFNCGGIKECSTAKTLLDICKKEKMAMMITRCKEYTFPEQEGA